MDDHSTIEYAMRQRADDGFTREVNDRGGASPESSLRLDLGGCLERLGGDEKLLNEIIDIFLEEAPKSIERLRSALANGDMGAVELVAHSMKGELGYLGVDSVSQQAQDLEDCGRNGDLERARHIFVSFESNFGTIVDALSKAKPRATVVPHSGAGR